MPEYDKIETICGSTVQHGPCNRRAYLMKLNSDDPKALIAELDTLAQRNSYTKIFAKVPESKSDPFSNNGYRTEARVPHFYRGEEAAVYLGRYLDESRAQESRVHNVMNNLQVAREKSREPFTESPDPIPGLFEATEDDAPEMTEVYREVFKTYPFPIHDPAYLIETMRNNVVYFGVRREGKLVALASSEMDVAGKNVEMTDFATLPSQRGQGLAVHLLRHMEAAMRERGMIVAHTIARALSAGMNITFAKCGYVHAGTLVNNTDICGQIESMNVWHRRLQ